MEDDYVVAVRLQALREIVDDGYDPSSLCVKGQRQQDV
jgi:hypothetical protein